MTTRIGYIDEESHNRWLDPSTGQTLSYESCGSQSKPVSVRLYLCCNREFYSAQALGGHQNAQKRERERDDAKRFHSLATPSFDRRPGVQLQAHLLAYKPTNIETTVAVEVGADNKYAATWVAHGKEGMWQGGYYFVPRMADDSQPSDPDPFALDLSLKL